MTDTTQSEHRPLYGQTIVVTRARDQAAALSEPLLAAGAEVILAPTIELQEVEHFGAVDGALRAACGESRYAWLVLTSANGVDAAFKRLEAIGQHPRALARVKIAAIGSATASQLRKQGIDPDLVPAEAVGESLAEALAERGILKKRILLLRADIAGNQLPAALQEAGAICDDIPVYRTVRPKALPGPFLARLDRGKIDWITLTSPSSFVNLLSLLSEDRKAALGRIKLASIGPVTTRAIRKAGYAETVEADPHDVPGLVSAILSGHRRRRIKSSIRDPKGRAKGSA